jgi:hypothetical protein
MNIRRFNWQIWVGVTVSIFAMLSYPFIFVDWPLTRDFPWANLLLFVVAVVFVFIGVRRAFGEDRGWFSKIGASVLAAFSVLVLGLFILIAFVSSRWMPPSDAAPRVGTKAPDFTLADTSGKRVSLNDLLTTPIQTSGGAKAPRGVLLIFYRGYW